MAQELLRVENLVKNFDHGGKTLEILKSIDMKIDSGEMLVDWIGADGTTVREDRLTVSGVDYRLRLDEGVLSEEEPIAGARVYVWDDGLGVDGIGWVGVTAPDDIEVDRTEETSAALVKTDDVESLGGARE